MIATLALAVLVALLAVPAWVHVGYPALLVLLARIAPKPLRPGEPPASAAVVVPAHDEEDVIEAKLRNLASQDGVAEIVVASDGSTDRTVAIASALSREVAGLRVLDLPHHGKAEALNAGVAATTSPIVVFTDADAMLAEGSLRALLAPFADPEVGAVTGHQRFRRRDDAAAVAEGEGTYWRIDSRLKALESTVGSAFASGGSLHAVRRELYVPIADPAQADDMAISMRVVLAGRRLIFAGDAVTWGEAASRSAPELARKIRVTNHSLRALLLLGPRLLTSGWYSVTLVSHKLLRHLAGPCLAAALVLSVALAPTSRLALVLLLPQLAVYLLGLTGWLLSGTAAGRARVVALPYWFCLAHLAALLGCAQVLFGRRIRRWEREDGTT